MSLKHPFKPAGTCEHCRFSSPIPREHWQLQHHKLFCHLVPPTIYREGQVYSDNVPVQLHDFCASFEVDGPTKQAHADDYHNSLTQDDIR